ncbi:MAG: dihydrodipicolinate reductase [Eubacteriales bacterium]|nr:dihydrodipicolinate reductase [Eubacteriales bacterium]
MTQIREKTLKMIERMPEEKVIYIFNILQNIEALSMTAPSDVTKDSMAAFDVLMKYRGTLPEDFDYKRELEEARDEKYVRLD